MTGTAGHSGPVVTCLTAVFKIPETNPTIGNYHENYSIKITHHVTLVRPSVSVQTSCSCTFTGINSLTTHILPAENSQDHRIPSVDCVMDCMKG